MTNVLSQLKPNTVWQIFEEICNIPHPSKHEDKIIEWLLAFAKQHGIEALKDKAGNVILRKPATKGKENLMGVIMQSHCDMVPQANSDTKHDFEKDSIIPRLDGEWVKATGTTLGADNGIGLAASLAVMMDKNLEHGPLECLITFDEETGMTGAENLEGGILKGDILLNLDSEDHGELYIGCAGGLNTKAIFNLQKISASANSVSYSIAVKGLLGGHSGLDINLGRGNANKIINRLLYNATKTFSIAIAEINGGTLRNAIPREAFAKVAVAQDKKDAFEKFVKEFEKTIQQELATADKNVSITIEKTENVKEVFEPSQQLKILQAIYTCPNGVWGMSADVKDLVESSNNLAIIKTENNSLSVELLQRSSVDTQKTDVADAIRCCFELAGAVVETSGAYPGWKPNMDSKILNVMVSLFKKLYNEEPKIKAIHAGLECGLLGKIYPHWDMISFGPTIRSPHSPDERVNIPTVLKFWEYLTETLKNIPKK